MTPPPSRHRLAERMRRLAEVDDGRSVLDDLVAGLKPAEIATRRGAPLATVQGVRSFYELLDRGGAMRHCSGTACWSARGEQLPNTVESVRCLGRCYEAPACTTDDIDHAEHPIPVRSLVDGAGVLQYVLRPPSDFAELYAAPGAAEILDRVERSGLMGRGGAAYPTGAKWRIAAAQPAGTKFVVVNGDEGDPGSFVDRLLLERSPHAVLAGANACARAIGASEIIVFVRGEYPLAAQRVRFAAAEATARGLLDAPVTVRMGAGSYVVGEETALLRAIEGLRGEPSPKPPYPAQAGLFGRPTVVQNVETLVNVPGVLRTGRKPDTKAFSISGAVVRPGAVDAPFGISLSRLLHEGAGGALPGRPWKMALIGGPMGMVVPATPLDLALDYATAPGMGHGGIVMLDTTVSPRDLALHLFEFAAGESCGSCTPCRAGTARLQDCSSEAALSRLLDTIQMGSLCGFGQGVPRPIRDLLRHFPGEIVARESA